LDKFGIGEEVVLILAPGQGLQAYTSLIIPFSRVISAGVPTDARAVLSWEGWGKSMMEGPVKSKEDLDRLDKRFAPNLTFTVSPRAATKGRYGGESSDKDQTPELHPVNPSFEGTSAQEHGRVLHEEWPSLVANQGSIRDATWDIHSELSRLQRNAGADIDTLEVKASETREVLGE
jgi:hypothetical protein